MTASRRVSRPASLAAAAVAALVVGACASGSPSGRVDIDPDAPTDTTGAREEGRSVRIEVSNDVTPPTSIVVYVELGGGARHRLGRVQPGHTEVFRYRPREEARRIRLLAQTNRGAIMRSDAFTLSRAGGVRWIVT